MCLRRPIQARIVYTNNYRLIRRLDQRKGDFNNNQIINFETKKNKIYILETIQLNVVQSYCTKLVVCTQV